MPPSWLIERAPPAGTAAWEAAAAACKGTAASDPTSIDCSQLTDWSVDEALGRRGRADHRQDTCGNAVTASHGRCLCDRFKRL